MTHQVEGLTSLQEILDPLVDHLDATRSTRHPVIRTKLTDERQPIPRDDRVYVYQRDNFRCTWCGSSDDLTLDHIKPWSAGGSDHVDNLRALCWDCNEHRSNFQHVDDSWRPLPLTHLCVDCESDLTRRFPDADLQIDHPSMVPAFCWWHRHPASGLPDRSQEAVNE